MFKMNVINWKTVIGASFLLIAGILALEIKDTYKIHPFGSALVLPALALGLTILLAGVLIIAGLKEKSVQ
jgi:hypothetical protein